MELRLWFRRYVRQHYSIEESFDDISRHYKPSKDERTTYQIPVSAEVAASLNKRGIVTADLMTKICVLQAEMKLTLSCSPEQADEIIASDFGGITYAEFVKPYKLDREVE